MKVARVGAGLASLVIAAGALAACGSSDGGGSKDTIKLGAWFPITGAQAASGVPQQKGAQAFFDQLNASGGINGKKIDFITQDNAFDPQQTLQIARQMVMGEGVDAIVTANGTAATAATFPFVLKQRQVPIFGTYGGSAAWYTPPQAGLFGTQALYEDQAQVATDWAIESGAKHLTVVRDDPAAFANVATVAIQHAKAKGIRADEVVTKIGTTDYAPVISQVKAKGPDAVLVILPPQEAATYLKEAKLQGVKAQAYGYAPATTEETLKLAGSAANGFRGVSLTLPATSNNPEVQKYRDAMKTYAHAEPDAYSLSTYATAAAFAQILKGIKGPITSASITEAIERATNIVTGIAPPMTFSSTQHLGTHSVVRIQVQNGQMEAVGGFVTPQS